MESKSLPAMDAETKAAYFGIKICTKCNVSYPISLFYFRNGNPISRCKSCTGSIVKEKYKSNLNVPGFKEAYLKKKRQYVKNKPDLYPSANDGLIWREVIGYERYYRISNIGTVKRHHPRSGHVKILKHLDYRGYMRVNICQNGKCKMHLVHRLVAMAFIPNPENKREVNHINGIKCDNRVENLEWCTRSENMIHAFKTGLKKGIVKRDAKGRIKSNQLVELGVLKLKEQ